MPNYAVRIVLSAAVAASLAIAPGMQPLTTITIDYPSEASIFPPDIAAPTFLWRDPNQSSTTWQVELEFTDGSSIIRTRSSGERLQIGEVDPRCIADTTRPPQLTAQQAAERTWTPSSELWGILKQHSIGHPVTVSIAGIHDGQSVSRGSVTIETSRDPVGAPIFYRDVPLMPSELEKGVIKPLAASMLPLVSWRLRNVSEPQSRLLMTGLPTCANCHSFSRDGKTLGMDLDGPNNDKGLYAIANLTREMSIRNEDVISWTSLEKRTPGDRVGFMSQVSPDGQYVVTTIDAFAVGTTEAASKLPVGKSSLSLRPQNVSRRAQSNYYVANFTDYRFLQVFYPTRGILAWYNRASKRLEPLPGADDPQFVHTNAVWSPDDKFLIFARAEGKDPYPEGWQPAEYANDPKETQIKYDLYRIPFNEGKGGRAEPVIGASRNGMSNSFPKVSPDGRWVVFVQCRNGQLMRPDSQLYIVPVEGGVARRMRCNTPVMNSWHSFSPNGRWLVFSSKSRSPYTQMFLTHLDEEGHDSPAILIENATAANRAVNIPEFVNIEPSGLVKIDAPALDFYRISEAAWNLTAKGEYEKAVAEWEKALRISPSDPEAQNNLGVCLAGLGRFDEAITYYQKALASRPDSADVQNNLGRALLGKGNLKEAIDYYRKALTTAPDAAEVHNNLGFALLRAGSADEAIAHLQKAVLEDPKFAEAHYNLGVALVQKGRLDEAIEHYSAALAADPGSAEIHNNLGFALLRKGDNDAAALHFEKAVAANPDFAEAQYNLGNVLYYMQGKVPEALAHWRASLRVAPDAIPVLNQTARVLATTPEVALRDGTLAVKFAERATQLSGGTNPAILDTLGAAYAEAGRFSDAVRITHRALDFAVQQNNQSMADTLRAREAMYEARTPLRETPPPRRAPGVASPVKR